MSKTIWPVGSICTPKAALWCSSPSRQLVHSLTLGPLSPESDDVDPDLVGVASLGFTGCLSVVRFNSFSPLKAALLHPDTSPVIVTGPLLQSSCGSSASANPDAAQNTRHLTGKRAESRFEERWTTRCQFLPLYKTRQKYPGYGATVSSSPPNREHGTATNPGVSFRFYCNSNQNQTYLKLQKPGSVTFTAAHHQGAIAQFVHLSHCNLIVVFLYQLKLI